MPLCSVCGNGLPVGARFCSRCGLQLIAQALPETSKAGRKAFGFIVIGFLLLYLIGKIQGVFTSTESAPQTSAALANSVDGTPPNSADELVIRCGKPYKDDSTAYDSPRPPLVTRFIEYKIKGTHLRFIYVPGNGHAGDPPPYDWKLQMVANVKTNKLYSRDQLSGLMPCTASVPAPRISTPPN
jgi:predicted nucleic acid-binding Zn ribbon protein